MNLENLSRKEKIELIKRIRDGEVALIGGEIIDTGAVIIIKEGKHYLAGAVESTPVDLSEFEKLPECTLVILPDNGRSGKF